MNTQRLAPVLKVEINLTGDITDTYRVEFGPEVFGGRFILDSVTARLDNYDTDSPPELAFVCTSQFDKTRIMAARQTIADILGQAVSSEVLKALGAKDTIMGYTEEEFLANRGKHNG